MQVREAWGFWPGETEKRHDVARYMAAFIEKKAAAPKDTLPYLVNKLLLNALIGKFGERTGGSQLQAVERLARADGMGGFGAKVASSAALRGALRVPQGVGPLFIPEWASLILGRSRAIMADIVARGALLVSTDAVIVPPDLVLDSVGLEQLRAVGSDLRLEHTGDAVFVGRSRLYAILKRHENVTAADTVLAQDDTWAVVRAARHGAVETKVEFAETVLACLAAGADVAPSRKRVRLLGAEAATKAGLPINSEMIDERRTAFTWDSKRRLLDRDVSLFRGHTTTRPYLTCGKVEAAEHQRLVRERKARKRRRPVSEKREAKALELLRQGRSIRDIANATGIPKSTVADLKKKYATQG